MVFGTLFILVTLMFDFPNIMFYMAIALLLLFLVGGYLLSRVNIDEGVKAAQRFDT